MEWTWQRRWRRRGAGSGVELAAPLAQEGVEQAAPLAQEGVELAAPLAQEGVGDWQWAWYWTLASSQHPA